jgi:hypothetical protein
MTEVYKDKTGKKKKYISSNSRTDPTVYRTALKTGFIEQPRLYQIC